MKGCVTTNHFSVNFADTKTCLDSYLGHKNQSPFSCKLDFIWFKKKINGILKEKLVFFK
jgi:hypothetical protein